MSRVGRAALRTALKRVAKGKGPVRCWARKHFWLFYYYSQPLRGDADTEERTFAFPASALLASVRIAGMEEGKLESVRIGNCEFVPQAWAGADPDQLAPLYEGGWSFSDPPLVPVSLHVTIRCRCFGKLLSSGRRTVPMLCVVTKEPRSRWVDHGTSRAGRSS